MGSLKSKIGSLSKLGSVARNVGQSASKYVSQKTSGAFLELNNLVHLVY